MTAHQQVWVKVNAQVDAGLAEVVRLLNEVPQLDTLQSCQGFPGEAPAYVYFKFGDWKKLCEFAFSRLAPLLPDNDGVVLTVEAAGKESPMAKLTFDAAATEAVAAALRRLVGN